MMCNGQLLAKRAEIIEFQEREIGYLRGEWSKENRQMIAMLRQEVILLRKLLRCSRESIRQLAGQSARIDYYSVQIGDLKGLPARQRNALHRAGIETLGDLYILSNYELLAIPGFGRHSLKLLYATLYTNGYPAEFPAAGEYSIVQENDLLVEVN